MNFEEELKQFDFMKVDQSIGQKINEGAMLIELFNHTLKRLGVDQSRANTTLDELLDTLETINDKNNVVDDYRSLLIQEKSTNKDLVIVVINLVDQVDDLYRYYMKNDQTGHSEQIRLLWENLRHYLMTAGFSLIETANRSYDPQIHSVAQVKTNQDAPEGMVLEVLKCGYIYQAAVVRKASVVVNVSVKRDDAHE